MAYLHDLADTWNDSGTTFTALKMNVTDTASNAASKLLDLQVGGVTQVSVDKTGKILCTSLGPASGLYILLGSSRLYGNSFGLNYGGTGDVRAVDFRLGATVNAPDVYIARDSANTLALRNSTNAQTLNVYNTYTDASNYERGYMKWSGNTCLIGTEKGGTGTARNMTITPAGSLLGVGANSTISWYFSQAHLLAASNSTEIKFGTSSDAGVARSAAGIMKITNGSTGTGQLIFVVPTADPAIAGALWNNGGTLAISAG